MKQNYKKLLENIYYMALHHRDLNERLSNDLSRDDIQRACDRSCYEAYAHVVQMVTHSDTIGSVDYKKVHKMEQPFPTIYT